MGCCNSSPSMEDPPPQNVHQNHGGSDSQITKFSFSDLNKATENFYLKNIVSENGGETSDTVYKGRLHNGGFIAVKKFMNMAWSDSNQFVEEAHRVGKLRHNSVVNLIGYCCDGNERLLVAAFMPNDTLAKRLFHRKNQTMEWEMRLRVAFCVAQALDFCSGGGFTSYNNLNAYSVLFNEDGDACLSCFGLMKEFKDDQRATGCVNSESLIFGFGTLLMNLLSGKQIPPSHAPEMIHGKSVVELIDPNLKGKFSAEEATIIFKLASQCLQYEDIESLNTKDLVTTLETLHTKTNVRALSYGMLEMAKRQDVSLNQLSTLGDACLKMDLKAIHKILVMAEDDKELVEFSFEEWLEEVKDIQEVRKHGDQAFLEQDFETAIDCYSQLIESRRMVYPSVYARRCLCYLFCNQPDRALKDGMVAQQLFPDWPTAFYLQSVALSQLNMITDSADTLKEATLLEAKRQHQEKES
ncbi:unnamed protein product [Brassica rapa]|uniref:Serine/threonine-protein kinase BSK n=1 Tax=Brassica campestris TaxID=3711 RepID=A0A3P6A4V4_BRACM|nr:unnamed protein product [Brassica rapa]VDC82534.1 unnamed protein product [Brassica rapa]